jgi:CHAT domain-containing protein
MRHQIIEGLTRGDLRTLIQGPDDDPEWSGWLGAYFPQFAAAQAHRDAAVWADVMPQSEKHRRAFEEADAALREARDRWRTTITDTLDVLGRRLWPALEGMLREAGVGRVMLVPQGMLFLLPLHACVLGDEGKLVCDQYSVAYVPAGSVLARLAVEEEPAGGVAESLLVANPTGDLRHTPSEALAIQHTLGEAATRVLWEWEATEAEVVDAARDVGVIHFSGHGTYDWRAPEQSGLLLRDPDVDRVNPRTGEGIDPLTVAEMRQALRLSRTRLVTLSACETGLTETRRGLADEYIGLPGVLLEAGARAVVASLWAVDDLATALLMWQFYQAWDRGVLPVAEALRRAQEWLRTRSREQIDDALEELNQLWEPWRQSGAIPAMRDRAIDQEWEILAAHRRLDKLGHPPFAHPYWWAGFEAVGDVL